LVLEKNRLELKKNGLKELIIPPNIWFPSGDIWLYDELVMPRVGSKQQFGWPGSGI